MNKNRKTLKMPVRYLMNAVLVVLLFLALSYMTGNMLSTYQNKVLMTVGINIILAVSLNVATGYLGQLPLGHAGFMAVGAYTCALFTKYCPLPGGISFALGLALACVVAGLFGRQGLADGFARQVVQVRFEHVLRRRHERQAQGRVFRHLVEQRVDRVAALAGFAGDVAGGRRHPQAVDADRTVRQAVEVPQAFGHVGARLAEEQPLREVRAAGQLDLAGLGFIGIARQRVEPLAVGFARAEQRWVRVEPAQ